MRRALLATALALAACGSGASPGGGTHGAGGTTSAASTGRASSTRASSSGASSSSAASTGAAPAASSGASSSSGGQGGATGACGTCEGACADLANDPRNCGACGHSCAPQTLCERGACAIPTCQVVEPQCPVDHTCCGDACCPPWKMCCMPPDGGAPSCVPLDAGACPTSCAGCL